MEDTPDKIRRNVVVFSSTIVIGWYLDLKLADITKLVVSTDIGNVNAKKLWIVTFVILIYLFLRFRFDASTNSQISSFHNELKFMKKIYLLKYLRRKLNKINQTGIFTSVFGTSLADSIKRNKEQCEHDFSLKVICRLYIDDPWDDQDPIDFGNANTWWNGTVSISEEYYKVGSARSHTVCSGPNHDFSVPLIGRVWVMTHSVIHTLSYSKSAVDFIVPIVLVVLAMLITACKLIAIYYN